MIRYEWYNPQSLGWSGIADATDLRELADDPSEFTDTTLGVFFNDGGGGGMVYGEPADLLAHYTRIVQRLAARTAPGPDVRRLVVPVVVDVNVSGYTDAYGDADGLDAYAAKTVRVAADQQVKRVGWVTVHHADPDKAV